MKIKKAIDCFLDAKCDLSVRTLEQYSRALDHLGQSCTQLPAKPEIIRRALHLTKHGWVKLSWWRAWGVFFRWCYTEYGQANPMDRVEKPKVPEVEMRALEPEELAQVLSAARDDLKARAVVTLALDSGVRASEFGRLRICDVSQDTVRILGKGNRQVRVPVSPETHYLLQMMINNSAKKPDSFIFTGRGGVPLTRFAVYDIVRRCMERAGIPGPKLGPHCLRHSLGKNFITQGGQPFILQRIMRHRNITTTQKYVNLAMNDVIIQHHQYSPLKAAMRGAQGVLIKREVEEVIQKAESPA